MQPPPGLDLCGAYQRALSLSTVADGSVIGRQILDTGSAWSMTASKVGRRVQRIPLHMQPEIEGAGGATMLATHRVWRGLPANIVAIQAPGHTDEMSFLWGPAFRYDVLATEQLARVGISTVVEAPTGAVSLFTAGTDYRMCQNRVRCERIDGLWVTVGDWDISPIVALPMIRRTTRPRLHDVRPRRAQPTTRTAANNRDITTATVLAIAAPTGEVDGDVDDDAECVNAVGNRKIPTMADISDADSSARHTDLHDSALHDTATGYDVASDTASKPARRQLTPIEYGEACAMLGNPPYRVVVDILRRAGRRPTHVARDRPRMEQLRAIANQSARPMVAVAPAHIRPTRAETVVGDTLGSKFPTSAAGMSYVIVWTVKSRPHHTYVSFSARHTAAASWAGFRKICQEAGITVLESAVSQPIEFVSDNGTEFDGEFAAGLARAGITRGTSTPAKGKKHGAQRGELANRNLQREMRSGLVLARSNFDDFGHDARLYWDFLAEWSCRVSTVRRTATADGITLAWDQIVREIGGVFGARGTITLQAHGPERGRDHKQLADRSFCGLYLGSTPNGKHRMLLKSGKVMVTSDVGFQYGCMLPTTGSVKYNDTNSWLEPFFDNIITGNGRGLTSHPDRPPGELHVGDVANGSSDIAASTIAATGTGTGTKSTSATGTVAVTAPSLPKHDCDTSTGPDTNTSVAPEPAPHTIDITATGVANATNADAVDDVGGQIHTDNGDAMPTGTTYLFSDTDHFRDDKGRDVHIGDDVDVSWLGRGRSQRRHQHRGTISRISAQEDRYQVKYRDGATLWHPMSSSNRMPVLKRSLTTRYDVVQRYFDRRTHRHDTTATDHHHGRLDRPVVSLVARRPAPRPEVLQYLDRHGNIIPELWDGTIILGPEPAMPHIAKEDFPPDPDTVYQALAHPFALYWLHAIVRERRGHIAPANRPPTYHFTRRRSPGRPLRTKWVFVVKRREGDGSVIKFRARECIAGFHLKRGVDFTESYSGMTPWSDVMIMESLAALLGLYIWEADLAQAYAFAPMPPTPNGEPVIVQSSPGAQVYDDDGHLLHQQADQAWYGHPAAGFALAKHLHSHLTGVNAPDGIEVCPIPFKQNPFQPVMYGAEFPTGHKWHGEKYVLHISTDNLRTYGSNPAMQIEFMAWLRRNFTVTGGDVSLREQAPETFMGARFTYTDGSVKIDMPKYITSLLNEVGMTEASPAQTPMAKGFVVSLDDAPTTPHAQQIVIDRVNTMFNTRYTTYADVMSYYGHLVSSIGWIATRVGPVLLHAHSTLCRVLSAPTIAGFQGVKRVLRYLAGKTDMCRFFHPGRVYDWRNGDLPTWEIDSDASYADDPHDRRGQGGYVGGFEGQAATTATSKKTRRTCTSTDQSEQDFASSACKEAEYTRNWTQFFGLLKDGPTRLGVDNFATYKRAGAPIRKWSPSSKQHDVNEKYVIECVERGTIDVQHRSGQLPEDPQPTEGFRADAMTKSLPRQPHEFYYDEIQGRPLPAIGARVFVTGQSAGTITSGLHSRRSRFAGLVRVRYDDGQYYHVAPELIAANKGEE